MAKRSTPDPLRPLRNALYDELVTSISPKSKHYDADCADAWMPAHSSARGVVRSRPASAHASAMDGHVAQYAMTRWYGEWSEPMFNPIFTLDSITVERAADIINRPHEDYPRRVPYTAEAIYTLAHIFKTHGDCTITVSTILAVHRLIMHDCSHAGRYRHVPVRIGDDLGVAPDLIPGAMERIMITLDYDNLHEWYIAFQRIHPFEDGNGRVGGVVIAAASYVLTGGEQIVTTTI
jgi:hypothetical protein